MLNDAGGLRAAFQVTPIQEMRPLPRATPSADHLGIPSSRASGAAGLQGSLGPASLGSGHGHSWQLRLVVVQEALALLRALLIHPTLGKASFCPFCIVARCLLCSPDGISMHRDKEAGAGIAWLPEACEPDQTHLQDVH